MEAKRGSLSSARSSLLRGRMAMGGRPKCLWARKDQNTPRISREIQHFSKAGAVKGAADSADSGFTAAISAIMSLPLTDAEKAEAVRRLLNHQTGSSRTNQSGHRRNG
jgi:hypothetical protein